MTIADNLITAKDGHVLRRIADQQLFGRQVLLGFTYYLYGGKLANPYHEKPQDYEEIPLSEVPTT